MRSTSVGGVGMDTPLCWQPARGMWGSMICGRGWCVGGKVWLGHPDAQRTFMHMQGDKRMHTHTRVSLRYFKEFLLKYCHPEDKTGTNCPQDTRKNNNFLFILEKKRVTITFHRVPGRRDKETTK